jgi:hypothetical protein
MKTINEFLVLCVQLLLNGASTSERVQEMKTKIITYRATKSEGLKQQIIFFNILQ